MNRINHLVGIVAALTFTATLVAAPQSPKKPPKGFTSLFNGKDLSGWRGRQPNYNPVEEGKLTPDDHKAKQAEWNTARDAHWKVDSAKQGAPVFAGAHLFPAHDPKDLSAAISARGNVLKSVSLTPCTGGAADSAIADLSGAGLGPGTYIVSFRDPKGTTYAAGNLTINP